jgi:hypothetical protein
MRADATQTIKPAAIIVTDQAVNEGHKPVPFVSMLLKELYYLSPQGVFADIQRAAGFGNRDPWSRTRQAASCLNSGVKDRRFLIIRHLAYGGNITTYVGVRNHWTTTVNDQLAFTKMKPATLHPTYGVSESI